MRPQDKVRAINGHLINAKRSINEAIGLGLAIANGEEVPEPPRPEPQTMPFRPTSPNRDAARYPYMPGPMQPTEFMKPSRLARRGRHGSRRRR